MFVLLCVRLRHTHKSTKKDLYGISENLLISNAPLYDIYMYQAVELAWIRKWASLVA
jgi:hypothetical protein